MSVAYPITRPVPQEIGRRIAFLGVGWIGLSRLQAMVDTGLCSKVVLCDPSDERIAEACRTAPAAECVSSFDALLDRDLDGVVIATPSALHAEQALRAIDRGLAVFCQKPLARSADEVRTVIAAAKARNVLLGVDLSYRHAEGVRVLRDRVRGGQLGRIFDVELVFHNAYGPDKAWFYDKALSGGGCLMDLGIHLVDLALDVLDWPEVGDVSGALFAEGRRLAGVPEVTEDFASATISLANGVNVRLACSWELNAGCDAMIEASFHGTEASASFRNLSGSFYDFETVLLRGTSQERLVAPPDEWGGRAARLWLTQLAADPGYDPEIEHMAQVAETLDRIYLST